MGSFALRALERVHGHLGWLAVLALLHPAILLRRPARRTVLATSLATAMVTLTAVMGAVLYRPYRTHLKQRIFSQAPSIGWLFERKEHLAVGAVAFAWFGWLAHWGAPSFTDPSLRRLLARAAHYAFVASVVFAFFVAISGLIVASYNSFLTKAPLPLSRLRRQQPSESLRACPAAFCR